MVSTSKRLIVGLGALLFILLSGYSVEGQRRGRLGAGVNLSKEFDCPEEFGYYSHPSDCTMYYVCVFGGALLESCTGGLMYSQELQTCDWPRNVGCGGSGEVESATVSSSRSTEPRSRHATVTVGPTSRGSGISAREQSQRQQQDEIAKHQLYADDVGPAEEVENDRQQRVYRGQPATITLGQNLDTRHQVTNAIPVPSGREKIAVISFGTHQQQQQPQQSQYRVEPTPAPSTYVQEALVTKPSPSIYNGSQQYDLAQFDPYYSLYDEDVELYRDIDYSQFPSNQGNNNNNNNNNQYRGQNNYKQQAPPQQEQRNAAYAQPTYNNQDVYTQTITPQDYNENSYNNQQNDDQVQYQPIGRQPTKTSPPRQQTRLRVETTEASPTEHSRPTPNPTTTTTTSLKPLKQMVRRILLKTALSLRDPFKSGDNHQPDNRNSNSPKRITIAVRDQNESRPKTSQGTSQVVTLESRPKTRQGTSQVVTLGTNLGASSRNENQPRQTGSYYEVSPEANNRVQMRANHAKVAASVGHTSGSSSKFILDSVLLDLQALLPTTKETPTTSTTTPTTTTTTTTTTARTSTATPSTTVQRETTPKFITRRITDPPTQAQYVVEPHIWPTRTHNTNSRIVVADYSETLSPPEATPKYVTRRITEPPRQEIPETRTLPPRKFFSPVVVNSNSDNIKPTETPRYTIRQSTETPQPHVPVPNTASLRKPTVNADTQTDSRANTFNQDTDQGKQNLPQSRILTPKKSSFRATVETTKDYNSDAKYTPKEEKENTLSPIVRPYSQMRKAVEKKINEYNNYSDATRLRHKPDSHLSATPPTFKSFVSDNSLIQSEATTSRSRARVTDGRIGNLPINSKYSEGNSNTSNEIPQIRLRPTSSPPGYQATPDLGPIRAPARNRGSASYTTASGEPTNRGTPATVNRARPTLKPSTAIVSKEQTYVDIYRFSPSRPEPVYATPQVDKTAAKCRKDVCLLPDCSCGGKDIPGGLSVEETPQIVVLTFDDAVNDLNKDLYTSLFEKGRKNPNGCPIAATFYVSHEWTDYSQVQNLYADGHEMASHSVSHSFGEQFSQKKWTKEIAGQREILAAYGGVKLDDVRGMRAPFLAVGGNKMFKMLYDSNFTYDSSMPVYENKPPSWPYTFDYKIFHDCMIPPCPTRSYPGVWEVPMVMWQDLNGGRCSMGDACSNPPTSDGVYKMLVKNFERHFTSNRAPFGLYYHAAWFTQPHHKEGFEAFLDTIVNMPEVWLVTNWQAIQWVRDPTPLSRLNNFQPFQCNYPERPRRCNNPKVCNLWHKSGVRYMRTCQACPDIYPWTGKSGVRNSRVDNEIIEESP